MTNFSGSTALNFRFANRSDANAVTQVYLSSRRAFLAFAPIAHSDAAVHQWMQEILIPTHQVTVVEQASKIIGMMALSRDEATGWIEQLYLHPNVVGQGIGSALIKRAKAQLGSPIRLYTFQDNQRAIRFYEKHGFQPVQYGDGAGNEEHCPDILFEWRV